MSDEWTRTFVQRVCVNCGRKADAPWTPTWIVVETDTQVDLCSWECVANYAASRAGLEVWKAGSR